MNYFVGSLISREILNLYLLSYVPMCRNYTPKSCLFSVVPGMYLSSVDNEAPGPMNKFSNK